MWLWLACVAPEEPAPPPAEVAVEAPALAPVPPAEVTLVRTSAPGVSARGEVRRIAAYAPTWMEVSPDGRVAVTASFPGPAGGPALQVLDLEEGVARPLPAPVEGAVWQPRFLDGDGRDWRVVALWGSPRQRAQGLYAFRLSDPAATWTPWAVTGTHVRDFWLVEDRTQVILLSFRPDGKRDSDRLDVAPITDGLPDLSRSYRVAPEIRAIQQELWDERRHRFGFWDIDARAAREVPLEPGAPAVPWPAGGNTSPYPNPHAAARDVVLARRVAYEGAQAVAEDGSVHPLLSCEPGVVCAFLAFSPVRRELWFSRQTGPDDGAIWVAQY